MFMLFALLDKEIFNYVQVIFNRSLLVVVVLNTFLTRYIQMNYLSRIKYFGLPISVSRPVYRNVNDEESLLVSVSKGYASLV